MAKSQRPPEPIEEDEDYLDDDTEEDDSPKETKREAASAKADKASSVDGSSSKKSLADRFNSIASASSGDANKIPVGKYEAIISDVVQQPPDNKGQSIRFKFELCDSDFENQNQITQWFKIFDANEQPFEVGIRMLSQALAKLGYQLTWDEMDTILEEIVRDKPGVIIKVSYSEGKDGRVFQNAIIEATCDNDVIQAYKDTVPY